MKCPIDQTEMEKGDLANFKARSKWLAKVGLFFSNGPWIVAYRCPKCGKVELTTEVK